MPSGEQHETKVNSNLELLTYLEAAESPSYDWMVTVYFYSALHLIEKKLSEYGKHSIDHGERNKLVRQFLRNIQIPYDTLYIESQNARYNCLDITQGKVQVAKSNFQTIKKALS